MSSSEARFTINIKEGLVELEGKESFVDKHLEKFEEIFRAAVKQAILRGLDQSMVSQRQLAQPSFKREVKQLLGYEQASQVQEKVTGGLNAKHASRASPIIHPIAVDLKPADGKPGLREFYAEKRPANHYEKAAVFVYYLTKHNKQTEVRLGEMLSCYEEMNEKKPSILDIVKNSIRYKGWLEQGSEKYAVRLTISGENFIKFDLPRKSFETAIS